MHPDAVASMAWPLLLSDGHTGRAVKINMRDMHIAYRVLASGLAGTAKAGRRGWEGSWLHGC